jgi:predicted aconitase
MLNLTDSDLAMLDGRRGPGARMAMTILVQMAEVWGAHELLDITAAHVDSTIYVGEANLEFAERLAGLGARVAVPTTLNVSGVDEHGWRDWPVPADWAHKARRQMAAYLRMGGAPTWTCAPYQAGARPGLGQQVAWGESNAIAFVNSVLGARTERYPDLLDICCAITGRAPAAGLHLAENRAAEVLVRLTGIPTAAVEDELFYPVLGYRLGRIAGERVPAVTGLPARPGEDQLKALAAAAASSGAVGLFHIVGVTPEAPSLEAAAQGRTPALTVDLTLEDLAAARRELDTAEGEALDLVTVGCPHLSLDEWRRLAALLGGRRAHPGVTFLVTTCRDTLEAARRDGFLAALEAFGGRVTVDTCPLASPMLPPEVRQVMTNSGKHAYYAPGLLGTRVALGSLADCVRSAVAGRIVREEPAWTR